jgi:hypothetical protein
MRAARTAAPPARAPNTRLCARHRRVPRAEAADRSAVERDGGRPADGRRRLHRRLRAEPALEIWPRGAAAGRPLGVVARARPRRIGMRGTCVQGRCRPRSRLYLEKRPRPKKPRRANTTMTMMMIQRIDMRSFRSECVGLTASRPVLAQRAARPIGNATLRLASQLSVSVFRRRTNRRAPTLARRSSKCPRVASPSLDDVGRKLTRRSEQLVVRGPDSLKPCLVGSSS